MQNNHDQAELAYWPERALLKKWPRVLAIVIVLVLSLPLISIGTLIFFPTENIWPHLWESVLPGYIWRTLALLVGVGSITFVLGTAAAWLVTMYNFPGRRFFVWAALTPLAMPSYIISYTYVDFLTYSGALQTTLRKFMGWQTVQDFSLPEVRSLGGAIVILSLVLYPYVYIAGRASFLALPAAQLNVARTLGRTRLQVFTSIELPQARQGLVVGVSLVLMECLNDIAAVGFFGVETLTLGIYTTWLGQGNLGGAAQLSSVLLIFVFTLIAIERLARKQKLVNRNKSETIEPERPRLTGLRAWAATLVLGVPIALGFVLPTLILCNFAAKRLDMVLSANFLRSVGHSIALAGAAAVLTLAIGGMLAYHNRNRTAPWFSGIIRAATAGYAIPGTVLGLGVLIPLAAFDNWFDGVMRQTMGFSSGLILSGSVFALLLAYVIRFMAIGFGNIEAGLLAVTPNIDAAARTLGRGPRRVIFDVHLPILRPALISAGLLVFVDAMKELPATLILRPFDFETLATQVFQLASLDQLEDSAIPALTIVFVGLLPIIYLARQMAAVVRKTNV